MTYKKVDLALFIWYAIAVVFGNVMNLRVVGYDLIQPGESMSSQPELVPYETYKLKFL
jgi:hypothetical protein